MHPSFRPCTPNIATTNPPSLLPHHTTSPRPQAELDAFEDEEKARRLKEDGAFAADQDVEAKKARSLAEQAELERQEALERAAQLEAAMDDGLDDDAG